MQWLHLELGVFLLIILLRQRGFSGYLASVTLKQVKRAVNYC